MSAKSVKTPAKMSARGLWGLMALGALAAASGCGPGFDPYNRLLSLRVLAVRSQPVAPAAGEETTIDAKVYTTDGTPPDSYAWSWCPFAGAPGAPCPITADDLSMAAGIPISYDLGSAPTAKLANVIPAAILQAACAGRRSGGATRSSWRRRSRRRSACASRTARRRSGRSPARGRRRARCGGRRLTTTPC